MEYETETFLWVNDDGNKLRIKSNDRTLVQRYPLDSYGFQFSIDALIEDEIQATIPFSIRFYEIEVPGIGKERFPTLTGDLEDIWLIKLDAHMTGV